MDVKMMMMMMRSMGMKGNKKYSFSIFLYTSYGSYYDYVKKFKPKPNNRDAYSLFSMSTLKFIKKQ